MNWTPVVFLMMFGFPKTVNSLDMARIVYVEGSGEAANVMRVKLQTLQQKYGTEACFVPGIRAAADAVLVVSSEDHASGFNTLLAGIPTTSVSGEVDATDGTVLWPQMWKAGAPGITPDGALKSGAGRILESLYRVVGCDKQGRRRRY